MGYQLHTTIVFQGHQQRKHILPVLWITSLTAQCLKGLDVLLESDGCDVETQSEANQLFTFGA